MGSPTKAELAAAGRRAAQGAGPGARQSGVQFEAAARPRRRSVRAATDRDSAASSRARPTDAQPVFEAIVASAARLCDAGLSAVSAGSMAACSIWPPWQHVAPPSIGGVSRACSASGARLATSSSVAPSSTAGGARRGRRSRSPTDPRTPEVSAAAPTGPAWSAHRDVPRSGRSADRMWSARDGSPSPPRRSRLVKAFADQAVDRHRERAPVHRAAGAQSRSDRLARPSDRHRRGRSGRSARRRRTSSPCSRPSRDSAVALVRRRRDPGVYRNRVRWHPHGRSSGRHPRKQGRLRRGLGASEPSDESGTPADRAVLIA